MIDRLRGHLCKLIRVEIAVHQSAAPTALVLFLLLFPRLTPWANFCRAYGAGWRDNVNLDRLWVIGRKPTELNQC
jgi:hypothetical protein